MNNTELLSHCIMLTSAAGFGEPRRGKVRDVYLLPDNLLAIVATDRIFGLRPYHGGARSLQRADSDLMAAWSLQQVRDIVPVHLIDVPHPNITIARKCDPIPVEVVVRGCLTGHAWRLYQKGIRVISGVRMPDGLREFDRFGGRSPSLHRQPKPMPAMTKTSPLKKLFHRACLPGLFGRRFQKLPSGFLSAAVPLQHPAAWVLADTKYEFGF